MAETQTSTSTSSTGTSNENGLAAVAYIFTWITGLIVFFTSKPTEKYKRWHAVQAIGLGIAMTALYVLLNILLMPMMTVSFGAVAVFGVVMSLIYLGFLVLIIFMAVTAYQGKKVRLPVLAGFADKHA